MSIPPITSSPGSSLGDYLQHIRRKQEISTQAMAERLKLSEARVKSLEAISDKQALDVFDIGHLSTYCHELNISFEEVKDKMTAMNIQFEKYETIRNTKDVGIEEGLVNISISPSTLNLLMGAAAVLALVLGLWGITALLKSTPSAKSQHPVSILENHFDREFTLDSPTEKT